MKDGMVRLGYELGTGKEIRIPMRHSVVTGQTQEAGKTTTLEALIDRSRVRALAFITKRGEGSFGDATPTRPYFREDVNWEYVASILEANRGEKMKFERSWIIKMTAGASTLEQVHRNVKRALLTAKGINEGVYTVLDAYLEQVVPQIRRTKWATSIDLEEGVNVMDLTALSIDMQHLVIRASIQWILENEEKTVVLMPEAWKFVPEGRGTPVKLAAESFIRQGAGLGDYLWLDSQDISGVDKTILKMCPVWILGVQREANEIRHTLNQIPKNIKKPTPADIATLGVGQFIACWSTHTIKVYVQPKWMDEQTARRVAMGHAIPIAQTPTEGRTVNEKEAQRLKADNDRLAEENAELRERIESLESIQLAATPQGRKGSDVARKSIASGDGDLRDVEFRDYSDDGLASIYDYVAKRLAKEAPKLLKVAAVRPELEVAFEPEVLRADGNSLRGRIARLYVDGWFDKAGVSGSAVQKELARRGKDPGPGNTYKELDTLAEMGFLTIEDGRDSQSRKRKEYLRVPGMKVTVVQP